MSLWHAEREFRDKGEEFVANSLKLLRDKFGDISLPVQGQEAVSVPLSKETQKLVERLKKDGYVIYDLDGKTPSVLRDEGMKFWYLNPALEQVSSKPSLIAFNPPPDKFFLEGSGGILYEKQLELLENRAGEVEKKYPRAGLVVREGHVPEWVETAFAHFKATDQKLFGSDYNFNWTWTDTYESDKQGARRAYVGIWVGRGLRVGFGNPDDVRPDLRLAPVVEIPRI